MTVKYLVRAKDYARFLPRLKYIKETGEGADLILTKTRLKTFLSKTDLTLRYCEPSGIDPNILECVLKVGKLPAEVSTEIDLNPDFPKYPVYTERSWNGYHSAHFAEITQRILSPVLKRPIDISVAHYRSRSYKSDNGNFQIYIWSTPSEGTQEEGPMPDTLYGHRVSCTDSPFRGSGLPQIRYKIMHGNYCVAELFDDTLFIHYDICHHSDVESKVIYAHILSEVVSRMDKSWKPLTPEEIEARKRKLEEESLMRFAQNSTARIKKRKESEVSNLKELAKKLRDELFDVERELANINLGAEPEAVKAQVLEEFRKLKEGYANIQEASFCGSTLTVVTSPINAKCKRSSKEYHLGRVEINIPFDSRSYLTMRDPSGKYRIPHTSGRGRAKVCLGTAESDINSYRANYEMLAVVSFMVAFLENGIDTNDEWGAYLTEFPYLGVSDGT